MFNTELGDDTIAGEELRLLRETAREFAVREVVPHRDTWRREGMVSRDVWKRAGELGLLCAAMPTQFGGGGTTYRHDAVIVEELARIGFTDFAVGLQSMVVAPYIESYGSEAQKRRWLPGLASGTSIGALALSEPGAGSDLKAMRTTAVQQGEGYRLSGQKTFVSNGQLADLVIVAAKSNQRGGGPGISLFVVETAEAEGFRRGRRLEKIGLHAQDTSEMFFDDVFVEGQLLGRPNEGFDQLMQQLPQERMVIAISAVAVMEAAIDETLRYVRARRAFGRTLLEFQNTRFVLATAKTEAAIARTFLNDCLDRLIAGTLDGATAAMAKWWTTEKQCEVVDACLQLFGGYGFMAEYPIAHMWADARVQKIYGGTNEIMKELIARSL